MTALDQAFIRAYTRPDVVSPLPSSGHARSVPLDDALLDPAFEESTDGGGDVAAGEMADSVAKALAGPSANRVSEEPQAFEADQAEEESTDSLGALLGTSPTDGPSCERRIDAAHGVTPPDIAAQSTDSRPIMAEVVSESDRDGEFLPLLRVEHFLWPEACLGMSQQAPEQLNLLTDSLVRQSAQGRTVVGFGVYGAGEGCTTILLSAARSLASSGMKTIMVDADFDNPCLDERLGIACQIGWGDVLDAGEPLEEAAVESDRDRLALLPLGRQSSDGNDGSDRRGHLASVLRQLREHYDLVLVDLGKLDADAFSGDRLGRSLGECIDAVVVVRDVRNGARSELDEVKRLLQKAELVELGVVENFV